MNSKPNDLWYTPKYILDAVDKAMGGKFVFDPCPIDPIFDGLDVPWPSNCYINPPYSRELKRAFIEKAIHEYNFTTDRYIWLVNYACSEDLKVLKEYASAVCLPHKRVKFRAGHESLVESSPRYDNIILLWGDGVREFRSAFGDIGTVFQ